LLLRIVCLEKLIIFLEIIEEDEIIKENRVLILSAKTNKTSFNK